MSVPSLSSNRINPGFNALDELQAEVNDLSAYVYSLSPSGGVSQAEFNDLSGYVYSSLQVEVMDISNRLNSLDLEVTDLSTYVYNLPVAPDLSAEVTDISNRLNSLDLEVTDLSTYVYNLPAGTTPSLSQVLTVGRDANALGIYNLKRLGMGVIEANQGNAIVNISPVEPSLNNASSTIYIAPRYSQANTNPTIFMENFTGGTTQGFVEYGAGTVFNWIAFKSDEAIMIGGATGTNAQSFSPTGVFTNTVYSGYNPGITSGAGGTRPFYGSAFNVVSDERTKQNILDLCDNECLDIVRQIEPKKYIYTNKQKEGFQYGFIAQNLKKICPELVYTGEGYTADYYNDEMFIKDGEQYNVYLSKSYSVSVDDIIQIEDKDDVKYDLNVVYVKENHITLQDKTGRFTSGSGIYKVIGKRVKDFNYIKTGNNIDAIIISCIQEIDRIQNEANRRIMTLEREILEIKSKLG